MEINWDIWSVVLATMLTGVIMALAIYFTTKNLNQALVEGIGVVMGSVATVNTLESVYTDVMPDEWEPVVSTVLDALRRKAQGTATEADDAVLDLLKRVTDGLPNDAEIVTKVVAG
ncbi:hypothetical protein ACFLYO_10805 [Chloroflexota bacterium]